MEANVTSFIRKWSGRTLQDDGCVVSKEYHSFQIAFINAMRKIAKSFGGEVVNPLYGHYDVSGFIKKGDKYVYFSYDNTCGLGGRTYISLKDQWNSRGCSSPLLIREAESEKDYCGDVPHFTSFEKCQEVIENLLNIEEC